MNSTVIVIIVLLILVYIWFTINSYKGKCLVYYRRRNKQKIKRLVKATDSFIVFEKKRFDLTPDRAQPEWVNILGLFGTWVMSYDFSWYSRFAHDPNQFESAWETPDVRNSINQEERMKAFTKVGESRAKEKTKSSWMSFLPYIIIGAILIFIVYTIYTQGKDMTVMKQAIQSLLNSAAK